MGSFFGVEPFLGEITIMAGDFVPKGWAACDGQLLSISENQALFTLIGTSFGGDGITTFGLPDLRGRVPMHAGGNSFEGERGGEETHTLTIAEMPAHSHRLTVATSAATSPNPSGNILAAPPATLGNVYGSPAALQPMSSSAIGMQGGSQPHNNMQPWLSVCFVIAIEGIYPSQT